MPALRLALGCPLQMFDGEVAAVVVPLLQAAEKKRSQQVQALASDDDIDDDPGREEARTVHTAINELLAWAKAFPKAVFEVC